MVGDRRFASRYKINMDAILYMKQNEVDEIDCIVKNISEHGVCFEIDNKYLSLFQVSDVFKFCIYDSSMRRIGIANELISGKAIVKYINQGKNNKFYLGCLANSEDMETYIRHKIVCYTIEARG